MAPCADVAGRTDCMEYGTTYGSVVVVVDEMGVHVTPLPTEAFPPTLVVPTGHWM
jgi:hypothetical protein